MRNIIIYNTKSVCTTQSMQQLDKKPSASSFNLQDFASVEAKLRVHCSVQETSHSTREDSW